MIWDSINIKRLLSITVYNLKRNEEAAAGALALHDIQSKAKNTFCSLKRVISRDATAAISWGVSKRWKSGHVQCWWPMLQTSPVVLFSNVNIFICSNQFPWLPLYCLQFWEICGMAYKFFISIACSHKCFTRYCLDRTNYLLSRWMKVSKRHGKIDGWNSTFQHPSRRQTQL